MRSSSCGELLVALAQGTGERTHVGGVEAGERRDQQSLGRHRVEVVGVVGVVVVEVDHGAQRVEQRAYGGLAHERGLVAGHLDGHAGPGEATPQHRDRGAPRADQHRHLRPGDAVLEMGPPEQVGDPLDLGALGVVGEHLDPVGRPGRECLGAGERGAGALVDAAGQRDPGGDALARGQHPRPEAAYDGERAARRPGRRRAAGTGRGSRGSRAPRPHGTRRSTGAGRPPR